MLAAWKQIILFKAFPLLLLLTLASCMWYGPPPGKGAKSEIFYAKARPLIIALEQYHQDKGRYPNHLEELTPKYLKQLKWGEDRTSSYIKKGATYELRFSYSGPGMNSCTFTVKKQWQCSGFI